jgi:hypothetical protein
MDGLSAATTVISVLQTGSQVIEYVKAVKGAGEAREKVLLELIRARALLTSLHDVADHVKDDEWSRALQGLDGPDGALSTFKALLEEMMDEMGVKRGPKEASQRQQSGPLVAQSKRSRLTKYFLRHSSSSASSDTPSTPLKASNTTSNDHYRIAVAKLDTVVQGIKWPFTQPQIQYLLNRLERIKTHFLVALSSDNVRLSKLIRDQLQTVHGEVHMITDKVTAIQQHQEGSKDWTMEQRLVFEAISTVDFASKNPLDEVAVARLKEGASELLSHNVFQKWLTNGKSLLLSGGPGTGKTSICKVVETYLQLLTPTSEAFVMAIYFSYIDKHKLQSLQAVLASIVKTMLLVRPQFQKYYNRLMLTGEGPLEVTDCLRIIHRARQDFQHFYIVIDALDECDAQLALEIVERLTQLRTPLRIFATSRSDSLGSHFFHQITTNEVIGDSNMKAYLRKALAEKVPVVMAGALKNDPAKFDEVVDAIFAKSDGVCVLSFGKVVLVVLYD